MANRDRDYENRWEELNNRQQRDRYYPRERDLGDRASNRRRVWQDIREDESEGRRTQRQAQNRTGYRQGEQSPSNRQQNEQPGYREWNDYQNRERGWADDPYYNRYEARDIYDWDDRYNANWDYNNWMGPYYGIGPKNYQRGDERIQEDINERLTRHGQIDATDINVQVKDGEVTLDGKVENRGEKRIAERVADSVSGVKDVINNLKIQNK